MTEQDVAVEPGDDELIAVVRSGDLSAFGLLFARHRDAAQRLARQLTRGGADADDLVAGAFEKVLDQLRAGKGPDVAFRAYLLTAMRRLNVDQARAVQGVRPTEDADLDRGVDFDDSPLAAFEHGTAAAAFASLPERWQTVLWHLDVEGEKPAAVAPILGMSANSVSALAYRAREGLRQAYLQQHLREQEADGHQWTLHQLGAYVRGGLSRRDGTKVREHLDGCPRCTAVYAELADVNANLGAVVGPAILGAAAAGYLGLGSGGLKVLAVVGGWWKGGRDWALASTTNSVVAVAGAVTAATLAGGLVYVAATQGADEVTSASQRDGDGSGDRGEDGRDSRDAGASPAPTAPTTSPSALPPAATPTPSAPPGASPGPGAPNGGPAGDADPSGSDGAGDPDGESDGDGQQGSGGDDGGADGVGQGEPDPEPALGSTASVTADVSTTDGVEQIDLTWDAVTGADGYRVYRQAVLAGGGRAALVRAVAPDPVRTTRGATAVSDEPRDAGDYVYTIRAVRRAEEGPAGTSSARVDGWAGEVTNVGRIQSRFTSPGGPRCFGASEGRLDLVDCEDAQRLTVRDGTIRLGGLCATRDAGAIVLETCGRSPAQQWRVVDAAQGGSRIAEADGDGRVIRWNGSALVLAAPRPDTDRPSLTRPERFDVPGRDGVEPGDPDDPDTTPDAPSSLVVTTNAAATSVRVTWAPVDDVDEYVVYRDDEVIGRASEVSFVDAPTPGDHVYSVAAVRDGRIGDRRTAAPVLVRPAPPSDLTGSVAAGRVTLSWDAPDDPDGSPDSYRVYRDGELLTGTTSTTVSDAPVSGTYTYTLAAVENDVESVRLGVTVEVAPLTAPSDVRAVESGGDVVLTWTGADDPSGYTVTRENGTTVDLGPEVTSWRDVSVADGVHTWTVTARRGGDRLSAAPVRLDVGLQRSGQLRFHDDYVASRRAVTYCVSARNGDAIITDCAAASTTQWSFYDDGTIQAAGRCLRADARGPARGVSVGACEGAQSRWTAEDAPRFGGQFVVNRRGDGAVLDAEGGTVAPGTPLIVYPPKRTSTTAGGNDNQRFTVPAGAGLDQ